MMPGWRHRFPVLHGWWIAVAQNVAPRRFHAHEQRLHKREQAEILTSSGLPTFALAGTPPDVDSVASERSVQPEVMGFMMAGTAGSVSRRRGPRVVSVLSTTEHAPGGGWMRFTSRRRSGTDLEQREHELMVHNFLASGGHPPWEPRRLTFGAERSRDRLTVPDDSWHPYAVSIDGQLHEFRRVGVGRSWLALGVVDDVDVAVEGHGFDSNPLELRRLDRPST